MNRALKHTRTLWSGYRANSTAAPAAPAAPLSHTATEVPTFRPVGSPASMLEVKLPASAQLNLRLGAHASIVAINGEIANIGKEVVVMAGSVVKPLLYQRFFNPSPLSFLISDNASHHNFTVLETNTDQHWYVRDRNLVAWHGAQVDLNFSNKLLHQYNVVHASGPGTLAVKASGSVFELKLDPQESILVNPSNLIAYNTDNLTEQKLASTSVDFRLPSFSMFQSLKLTVSQVSSAVQGLVAPADAAEPSVPATTAAAAAAPQDPPKGPSYFERFANYLKSRRAQNKSDKLLRVVGPATLLLNNRL